MSRLRGGINGIDRKEEDMEIIWRYEENCYVIDYNRYIAREKRCDWRDCIDDEDILDG